MFLSREENCSREPVPPLRRLPIVLFLFAAVCILIGTGVALWRYFGVSGLTNYSNKAVLFLDSDLQLPPELAGNTGRIRVVHFWNPDCNTCNKETDAHLNYLITMFRGAKMDFYSVRKPGTQGELPAFLQGKLKPLSGIEGMDRIPASPAIAIWAADGKLAYAGPYSEGLVCSSANSFVEPILNRLLAGEHIEPFATVAVGCYCPWSSNVSLNH
ncbi:hypothetical protein OKW33_003562 [Paraburkholderia atlantica]|uniref:DUF6436 domain-containing protein n=1 Tax=Paraburkholderia atlantica TaxID=2654982 RepID=UPI00128D3281|nr:DUF6436 domain-containing protein [Paraburkholderia atlantica]MBB5417425.1 hypothetical protein [Paraburkholderia atlantica]